MSDLAIALVATLLSSCVTPTPKQPKPEDGKKKLVAIVVQNIPTEDRR